MSFLSVSELQQSTAVTAAVSGNFTGEAGDGEELVVAKGDVLVLYRHVPALASPLREIYREKMSSDVKQLAKIPGIGAGVVDRLVVCFSEQHLVTLCYRRTFVVESMHHLGELSIPVEAAPLPPLLRVHRSGTLVALLVRRRYLFLFPVTSGSAESTTTGASATKKPKDEDAWGDEEEDTAPPPDTTDAAGIPTGAAPMQLGQSRYVDLLEDITGTAIRSVRDIAFVDQESPMIMFLRESESAWAGRVLLRDSESGVRYSKLLSCAATCVSFSFKQGAIEDPSDCGVNCVPIWSCDGVPYNAQRLVPLDNAGLTGALCCCTNSVLHLTPKGTSTGFYLNEDGKDEKDSEGSAIQWSAATWAAGTRSLSSLQLSFGNCCAAVIAKGQVIFSDAESGVLSMVTLKSDERATHELEVRLRGKTHPSCCLVTLGALHSNMLFSGSTLGDSVLMVCAPKDLKVIDRLTNVGPIVDCAVVDTVTPDTALAKSFTEAAAPVELPPFDNVTRGTDVAAAYPVEANPTAGIMRQLSSMELITAGGYHSSGALSLFTKSVKLHVRVEKPFQCLSAFSLSEGTSLKRRRDGESTLTTPIVLLSSVTSAGSGTLALKIGEKFGQLPNDQCPFFTKQLTLFAATYTDELAVQVSASHVRIAKLHSTSHQESALPGAPTSVALIRDTRVLILLLESGTMVWTTLPTNMQQEGGTAAELILTWTAIEEDICFTAIAADTTTKTLFASTKDDLLVFTFRTGGPAQNARLQGFSLYPQHFSDETGEGVLLKPKENYGKIVPPSLPPMELAVPTLEKEEGPTRLVVLNGASELIVYRFVVQQNGNVTSFTKEHQSLHDANAPAPDHRWIRRLQAFDNVAGHPGLHVAGKNPKMIFSCRGALRVIPHTTCEGQVFCMAPIESVGLSHGVVLCGEGKISFANSLETMSLETEWPARRIPLGATPHNVVSVHETRSLFAITSTPEPFRPTRPKFDVEFEQREGADGHMVFEEVQRRLEKPMSAADGRPIAMVDRYSIHHFHTVPWKHTDELKLDENEQVLGACEVQLAGPREDGKAFTPKDIVDPKNTIGALAVATGFPLGEDVPTRGRLLLIGTRIRDGKRSMEIIHSKTMKGPVTAVSSLDGQVVCSVGATVNIFMYDWVTTKLVTKAIYFGRASYVTSIATMKNYLLLGDLQNSVTLLKYRTDNHTLIDLGKDPHRVAVTSADFAFDDGAMGIVSTDEYNNIHLFRYLVNTNAQGYVVESNLQEIGEFKLASPITKLLRLRVPSPGEERLSSRSVLLFTTALGGIGLLQPLAESSNLCLRNTTNRVAVEVPQGAGLHPKLFRGASMPDGKPVIAKNRMIDIALLDQYTKLSLLDRIAISRSVGTKDERVVNIIKLIEEESQRFF